jgi:hypothetical protein
MNMKPLRSRIVSSLIMALAVGLPACSGGSTVLTPASQTQSGLAVNANGTPLLQHVFVIILENQAEDNTFGVKMPVPYLQNTVSAQGAFITNYWGTSHFSLGNYVSLLSGESATTANQGDCGTYTQIMNSTTTSYNQVQGSGCVYPPSTLTLADQLTSAGYTYKGYMEDMGNDPTREGSTCGQVQPTATTGVYGGSDISASAQPASSGHPQDQYAQRHNPFVYFTSLIASGSCAKHVVPLNDSTLTADLGSVATTANFTFITPNLCDDGHDVPCKAPGSAGTTTPDYNNENAFLQKWVPIITRSPAFLKDGLLMITFDESSPAKNANVGTDTTFDGTSCCQEASEVDPNTTTPGIPPGAASYGITDGSGGGKTGTILLSPYIAPGTVSGVSYNHYAALHSFEDEFGLSYLGFAAYPGTTPFGTDIFGTNPRRHTIAL